ncbi:hypothetical protein [Microvirga flavescens]|uniref:hypothetical protein n=1 Tax=Microvirga flavescens TaxID=2249811 RepID=UPI000DD63864|nr:hypothetical protein [Microvirga flavescens]
MLRRIALHPIVTNGLCLLPCVLLTWLFVNNLDFAMNAPACADWRDLGTGCLPIGWEGPFADAWHLKSRQNAIISAFVSLSLSLGALGTSVLVLWRSEHVHRSRKMVALLQAGLVVTIVLKAFVQDSFA